MCGISLVFWSLGEKKREEGYQIWVVIKGSGYQARYSWKEKWMSF